MKNLKGVFQTVFNTLASCIVPVMPVLIGAGMLKVFLIIFSQLIPLISETSGTYTLINLVANAGYYFLTVFVALSSAEVFKCNKYIAGLIGAMLLSPTFIELVNSGVNLDIFKIPVTLTTYETQVLTPVMAICITSIVERRVNNILPEMIQGVFGPLIVLLVMIPVTFCAIGPIGVLLGKGLLVIIEPLKKIGALGNAIYCAIIPFVVILGLGGPSAAIIIAAATSGLDPIIFFSNVLYNSILGVVAFAIYLRKRKSEYLGSAITATVGGASEPAIFGVIMPNIKALIPLCCGCFISGLISGLLKVKSFTLASFGILGIFATIGEGSSIIYSAISLMVGSVIAFVLTYIMFKDETN